MLSDSSVINAKINQGGFVAWLVCLSASLFFFYEFIQLNLFDVINQPLRDEFQLDATVLSWMSSAYLWADLLFLLPAGLILDRYSTRWVILISMLGCILGTLGFALTHSFFWATCFHFIAGIGNAFCFLACVVLVARWFPPRRQALVIGCVVTMAFLGGMMAHTPLAYLNEHYGWREALLIDTALGAVIFVWIFLFVKDEPGSRLTHTTTENPPASFLQVLANPQNWLAGFYTNCLNLPIMVLCALWGASYLQVVYHLSAMSASKVVSLIFIGSILGCPLVGWLSDRLGRRKPWMIIGALLTLLSLLPLLMEIDLSEHALGLLFFLMGVFTSTQVISYPLIAESNSLSNTGVATGIASVIIMGGAAISQIVFGWLMQYHAGMVTQTYSSADFRFAIYMFPLAVIAALIAVIFIRETHCTRNMDAS